MGIKLTRIPRITCRFITTVNAVEEIEYLNLMFIFKEKFAKGEA